MPSTLALLAIIFALFVSLTGALEVRARLRTERARRFFKYALVVAALVIALVQFVLQKRSAEKFARVEARTRARFIAADQRNAAVAALTVFAGQRYWIVVETNDTGAEQVRFGEQIDSVLVAAGWVKSQNVTLRESAAAPFREVPRPFYERGCETGVVIFAPADDLRAGAELAHQLEPMTAPVELASDQNLKGSVLIQVGPL